MIAAGDADIVVAGGMESMTNAPYLRRRARQRLPLRQRPAPRLRSSPTGCGARSTTCLMGLGTDRYNGGAVSRERQDAFAAAVARTGGRTPSRRGDSPTRSWRCRSRSASGEPLRRRARRGRASRHHRREPGRAAAGVRRCRQRHGRQRQPALRRRRRGDRDVARRGRAPRGHAARRGRRLRHGRRSRLGVAAEPAARGDRRGAGEGRARSSATSTCSRSTRRSPPSGSPRWRTSASPTRSPTSTAGRSPSGIRSG